MRIAVTTGRSLPPRSGRLGLLEFVEPLVRRIVTEHLGVPDGLLVPQASLREDLAADSLDTLEMVIALEQRLAISVPEAVIDRITTLGDLTDEVCARLWGQVRASAAASGRRAA